jgi:hypothetical protein
MVTLWASVLCGSEPGKNWSTSFKARQKDILDSRYLNAIDLIRQKMDQYNIQPHNCYNMDEKGFLIGHLRRSKGSSLRL